jgi:hypothetical protein
MSAGEFFGDLSVFETFIAVVALLTGAYTLYKSFIERSRISLYAGESVSLVGSTEKTPSRLWVSGIAANSAARVGVVQPLHALVTGPEGQSHRARWSRFITQQSEQVSFFPAHAIVVPPHSSTPFHVEFILPSREEDPEWLDGPYSIELQGWVDQRPDGRPRAVARFSFEISDVLSIVFDGSEFGELRVFSVPITRDAGVQQAAALRDAPQWRFQPGFPGATGPP